MRDARVGEALRVLAHAADEDGWDKPASLWALYDDDQSHMLNCSLAFRFDNFIGNPSDALVFLAEQWPGVGPDEQPHAVAFCSEAWMRLAQVDEDLVKAPPPSQHPDRIEVRQVLALDKQGEIYHLSQRRGGQPELLEPGVVPKDPIYGGRPYQTNLEGRLIDALMVLMTTKRS